MRGRVISNNLALHNSHLIYHQYITTYVHIVRLIISYYEMYLLASSSTNLSTVPHCGTTTEAIGKRSTVAGDVFTSTTN